MPYKNKKDEKEHGEKYYRENKIYYKEYNEKYYQDNKEEIKKNARIYSKEHREENKERKSEYIKKWFRTEKGRAIKQRAESKRRAIYKEIPNTLTAGEWLNILEAHNYRCVYCGVEFDCELLPTKDHIIPISKGGNNVKGNVVPACRLCNSTKRDLKWKTGERSEE